MRYIFYLTVTDSRGVPSYTQ